ncbi:hypothetical protein BD413DRAFT_47916 [Trametes elegans]|nr:hypothetical protein BD413DRAFT_47916 [Trametes elegans]
MEPPTGAAGGHARRGAGLLGMSTRRPQTPLCVRKSIKPSPLVVELYWTCTAAPFRRLHAFLDRLKRSGFTALHREKARGNGVFFLLGVPVPCQAKCLRAALVPKTPPPPPPPRPQRHARHPRRLTGKSLAVIASPAQAPRPILEHGGSTIAIQHTD